MQDVTWDAQPTSLSTSGYGSQPRLCHCMSPRLSRIIPPDLSQYVVVVVVCVLRFVFVNGVIVGVVVIYLYAVCTVYIHIIEK